MSSFNIGKNSRQMDIKPEIRGSIPHLLTNCVDSCSPV